MRARVVFLSSVNNWVTLLLLLVQLRMVHHQLIAMFPDVRGLIPPHKGECVADLLRDRLNQTVAGCHCDWLTFGGLPLSSGPP